MKKNELEKKIFSKFHSKYKTDNLIYNLNIIDNIIFNEQTHFVATFKDFLIYDDKFEFFKRYYIIQESFLRLENLFNYYSKKGNQFPNYANLREGDFILQNIFSKLKMMENLDTSIKQRKKEKLGINKNSNLRNTVFNSKVYDSIINDSENCLSIFSYDKESMYSEYNNFNPNNKNKGNDVNKIIKCIEDFENDNEFSFKKKNNERKLFLNDSLIKELNLNKEYNIDNTNFTEIYNNNNNSVYKKKKTPNNSLNKRKNKESYSTKGHKHGNIKNENLDYIDYKNLILYSENNLNQLYLAKGGSELNRKVKSPNYTDHNHNKNIINSKNPKKNKENIYSKINEIQTKKDLLTERLPQMIKVKINIKKKEQKNIKEIRDTITNINKNILLKRLQYKNIKKKIDKNKISYLNHKPKLDSGGIVYNKSIVNNNTINENNNDNKHKVIKSLENFDTYRGKSNNLLKDKKINLIKKNLDYNLYSDYIINKYKNKLAKYNNYTSIQFNNNNINIINSNSNTIRNNTNNNISNNLYGTFVNNYKPDNDVIKTLPNKANKSIEFKNKRKKLNKKSATYFYANNNEKMNNNKFNTKKKLNFFENFSTITNNTNNNINNITNNSNNITNINKSNFLQYHRTLNSDRITTPFNSRQNKKIFLKIYHKVNSNNKNEKDGENQMIANEIYKKFKNKIINKKQIEDVFNYKSDNFDKVNFTHTSLLNRTNNNINPINFNKSNYNEKSSSLYIRKKKKNVSDMIYFKNFDINQTARNPMEMNISKIHKNNNEDKKSWNNLSKILKAKKSKKDEELVELKKLNEKKKIIINQFNEQLNKIKLKFIKEIENKYEISKRNIINKRKNKLSVNYQYCK